ncbi:MAG: FtsX-like permease family protein, partial [Gammaproteobacteria bacterium]
MSLGWRLFWRETRQAGWWQSHLGLLIASLALSVAVISGMLVFSGQVKTALNSEAAQFLAADRALVSSRPVPPEWAMEASAAGLETARFAVFPSMVFREDDSALAVVKAVSASYPLRGNLSVSAGEGDVVQRVQHGPATGAVWLDARLLQSLQAKVGDLVSVGDKALRIEAVLVSEPDSGNQLSVMAPRLMMSIDDLDATGIVQPGSRVEYSELFAGDSETLETFATSLKPRLESWHRWMDVKQGRPSLARALDRAAAFLLLAGALSVLLASAAAWLASRQYAHGQRKSVAVLKALGADGSVLRGIYARVLLVIGALSISLGLLLGWLLQWGLRWLFGPVLSIEWPPADWQGFALGALVGVFCLLMFVWPFLHQLQRVSPDTLLREAGEQARRDIGFLPGFILLCVLVSVLSGWWRLG